VEEVVDGELVPGKVLLLAQDDVVCLKSAGERLGEMVDGRSSGPPIPYCLPGSDREEQDERSACEIEEEIEWEGGEKG
jgi:hypothetical protein